MSSTTSYSVTPSTPLAFSGSREYEFKVLSGGPVVITLFNDGETDAQVLNVGETQERSIADKGAYTITAVAHASVAVTENRAAELVRE